MAVCSSNIPSVEYEDIVSGQGILNKDIREKSNIRSGIRFEPGDVLFGKLRPYLKNWILPNFSGVAVGDFWVLHPFETDSRYLYYLIQTPAFQTAANQSTGTKMPRSDWNLVSKAIFFSPKDITEQRKIGATLQSIDHLITLHQREQDVSAGSTILINGKNNTSTWEQRKLSELATMHARIGWQNLRTSEFLDSGDYMLITGTDFEDGAINYSTCHYVEKMRYDQDTHIQIDNGSILITKDGTLGKVAYVQGLSMPATLNAGVFNVEIKDEKEVDRKYLFQYLKAPFLMDYVDKKATGGTIKHLNQNILVDFPVVLPNIEEQTSIGAYFSSLDNLITLHQRKQ